MAPRLGLVLLAGVGIVAFLLGSSSVPSATKMKVRRFVPFLDKHWRYIQTCPRVVTVEDFGGNDGYKAAQVEPIQLVYDGMPSIALFGDSITELSFDPERMGWASMLANTCVSMFHLPVCLHANDSGLPAPLSCLLIQTKTPQSKTGTLGTLTSEIAASAATPPAIR